MVGGDGDEVAAGGQADALLERAHERTKDGVELTEVDAVDGSRGAGDDRVEGPVVELAAGGRDEDDLAPAVVGVGPTFDETGRLEPAEGGGEAAGGLDDELGDMAGTGGAGGGVVADLS